jgi:hypothetical protein
MTARSCRRRLVRAVLTWLAVTTVAAACATLPPRRPVSAVDQIAGTWLGTAYLPTGAVATTTRIAPDGTYAAVVGDRTFTGTLTLANGTLRSRTDATGTTGTWSLHEGDGKRLLVYRGDDGRVSVELTPAH